MTGQSSTPRDSKRTEATQNVIIRATLRLLAEEGIKAISITNVARIAGVNRGTVYVHFKDREELISAAMESAAKDLSKVIRSGREQGTKSRYQSLFHMFESLSLFLMENSVLAQIWLNQIILTDKRMDDFLSTEWMKIARLFVENESAQPGIDSEIMGMWTLSALFIWPIWVNAEKLPASERAVMAKRFAREILRTSMYGNIRPGYRPS